MVNEARNIVIVLVNHNGQKDTITCVKSITVNDTVDSQIIIVDNSAEPENELLLLQSSHHNVTVLHQENNGFGAANNYAINYAKSHFDFQYLLLLNNDCEIEKSAITRMVNAFKQNHSIGIVTCKTLYPGSEQLVWYGGGEINYKRGWADLIDYRQTASERGANLSRKVSFASGCVMMFTKESITKLKGFDERMFMYVEDLELCIRASKENIDIWYESSAIVYHKVHGSFKGSNEYQGLHPKNKNVAFQFYHKKLNQWIAFRKHLRGKSFSRFFIYYWGEFIYTYFKLIVFSKQRLKVFINGWKVLIIILRNKYSS